MSHVRVGQAGLLELPSVDAPRRGGPNLGGDIRTNWSWVGVARRCHGRRVVLHRAMGGVARLLVVGAAEAGGAGEVMDASYGVALARATDQRPALLLMLGVLAIVWPGVTSPRPATPADSSVRLLNEPTFAAPSSPPAARPGDDGEQL